MSCCCKSFRVTHVPVPVLSRLLLCAANDCCLMKLVAVSTMEGNFNHSGWRPSRRVGPSLTGLGAWSWLSQCASAGSTGLSSALNNIAKHSGSNTS